MIRLPRTPPGHDASNKSLFGIVGNIWADPIDGASKVVIGATDDVKLLHVFSQGAQDL